MYDRYLSYLNTFKILSTQYLQSIYTVSTQYLHSIYTPDYAADPEALSALAVCQAARHRRALLRAVAGPRQADTHTHKYF